MAGEMLVPPSGSFESGLDFTVHDWSKKFECKTLSCSDFKEFWRKNVSVIYSPQPECDCLNVVYDEEKAQQVLFAPLEWFICGTKDTEKMFELLKSKDPVPTLCGKVFKSGEPTYSCRDCGLDPTCVLCVDCFRNSQHKNHRYKMSTSGGGGYCDCGDEEAWKTDAFCYNHHKGKSPDSTVLNAVDKLPPDLVERLRLVMRVVLQYCHQMLTWEHALNLPNDLQFQDKDMDKNQLPDTYACVLFNDETHTYEQVIETLGKAIGCSKKAAIDYATTIDREGRSIVKCSTFASCNQVRHVIERITSRQASNTLKVLVMHIEVIAHQTFAMRLLSWLQKVLSISEGFRLVFSQVMMETQESDSSLLESVMLCDTQLWKTARNQWHQLFISGMLMDQECKKTFAKVFTKNYPVILKEFIADDHDHSISVSSLSVQIFTVPTLAHALIQEESAISVLLRAFLSECERNKNEEGKLAFQRNQTNSFRRAQYILYDLKYLVTVQPVVWNDALRKNFLHGLQSFLNLLSWMQGMDSVTRQVGQHVEFEAEWETGINLQLKVASISTLLLGWCASDSALFVKAFRAALKVLQASSQPKAMCVCKEIANHSASCLEYDVSTSPVTIHLPLSRFVAGLFLLLEKFGLYYEIPQFQFDNFEKPSAEQLMELPLRTLVMLAQFRAGMWRRNGYSLLNQVFFYHNVRLRDEMFDRDIMMLQIAASMIESNEYLIHLIYKYGLLTWASESYDGTPRKSEDDNTRQVLTVAEEFLGTVLTVVSERFTPGIGNITEAERIKKEIIQLLCIEPMPHSQLFKMLPKDPNNETGMEEVVNEVASFKKPQGSGTGKYELKPEFYKCFNPFYYHYTREEQSRAEEVQLKRKKQACEEVCCPPPVPPEFCQRFNMIPNILQCDVMLHIIKLVLERTPDLHSSAFSEAQFEKVLHLIGVALHEEERSVTNEGDGAFFCFTRKFSFSLLEECLKSPRVESQKDLLKWVISKFKHVESMNVNGRVLSAASDVSETSSPKEEDPVKDRKMKAELAAARRARIMAQMSAMQKNFIKEHADMFKETVLEDSSSLSRSQMEICDKYLTEDPISVGSSQRGRTVSSKVYTCILCREDQEITSSGRALVLAAFVQSSSVLSKNRKRYLSDPDSYDPMLFPADLFCAPHCSTCGHVMHSDCWQKFFESVLRKEQRRPLRFGRHTSFEVDKNEFLCPLCERLSNGVIPLVPPLTSLIPENSISCTSKISVDDWVLCMKKIVENFPSEKTTDTPPDNADRIKQLASVYKPMSHKEISELLSEGNCEQFLALFAPFKTEAGKKEDQLNASLQEMMKLFTQTTYTVGLSSDPNTTDVRVPLMSWWSCSYTIHAIEWLLREQDKPLFGELSSRNSLCMEAVIRFSGASLQVFEQDVVRTHCVRMLRYLLLGERYLSSPQCCLDLDAFSVLVLLVLSMPVLLDNEKGDGVPMLHPVGTALEGHLMHLMFMFHLVQLLLTYPFDEDDAMETDSVENMLEDSEEVVASRFYKEVRTASGFDVNKPMPSGHLVVHCIKQGSIPFLRCCAIFFHVLTDTLAPESLKELGDQEFEHLCKYLGLSTTINGLLSSPSLTQLALSWVRHPRTLHLLLLPSQPSSNSTQVSSSDDNLECLVRHPLSVNRLVALPADYSELINSVSLFTCPNSDGDDSRNPSMCLVCGAVLCSQSYCCQTDLNGSMVGACTNHAHFCGSGVGVFLRIRDCKILLLSDKNKGCFLAPPYVDQYGETDQGLYRGNPLHLCPERYQELHELWLTHNVPEQVSHTMEQATSLPNWQLL